MKLSLLSCILGLTWACSANSSGTNDHGQSVPTAASTGPVDMGAGAGSGAGTAPAAMLDARMDVSWRGEVPEVCDGSNRIRLRYRVIDDPSRYGPGGFIPYQNGAGYWLITGDCEFYVLSSYTPAGIVYAGTLTSEQAQELGRRVHFGQFGREAYGSTNPVSHPSILSLELGDDSELRCVGCGPDTSPPDVLDAKDQALALLNELPALGSRWEGPIRVSVIERPIPLLQTQPESLIIDWQLRTPIEDVSILEEDWYLQPYTGALIGETDDLRALRALQSPPAGYGAWLVRGVEPSHYELRFRDAIPLEDENGEIQRSWEMGGDE